MQDKKPKAKPGPKPERLKLDGDLEDAAKRLLDKKRPPEGWPKHDGDDEGEQPSKSQDDG